MPGFLPRREMLLAGASWGLTSILRDARGEVAAPVDVHGRIRQEANLAPLAMRFTGSTAAEATAWQRQFGDKLRSLLGDFAPPKTWQTVVENRVEKADHTREELLLSAEGYPTLPVAVLTPSVKAQRRRAGLLMLHGHGPRGNLAIAEGENSGLKMVRAGYVVATPCFTPFGRRLDGPDAYGKQDACGISFIRLQLLGKLLIAENLRDALWALELLARRDDVDTERLGCAGLSYGGRMTMLAAAVEPRIKAAVVSGALNVLQERILGRYSCGAQVIPGLLQFGDVPEIGGLIAPRPAVWEWGSQDSLIDPARAEDAIARMQKPYAALGESDSLVIDRFDGGHQWSWQRGESMLEKALA
ncbi:MAG: prolyl oligopeptidase family serine peptidase [Pirellulaceae bacterium]|nr:prolyl oligopeptidase family serine peptidase [Pirellulaceae bacterium]